MANDKNIKLFKNNDKRDLTDMEWIEEFNEFLKGTVPEGIRINKEGELKLSVDQAYTVLWYLREHFAILPDTFCKCDVCDELFDDNREGIYTEVPNEYGYYFCGSCIYLAPYEEEE